MSTTTFEIRIMERGALIRHTNWDDGAQYEKTVKMFHIEARTRQQAIDKVRKHKGKILSCRHVDVSPALHSIEKIQLDNFNIYDAVNPYKNAIAMDEMIMRKRTKRRDNIYKDKE
jgi:hypothetical protein